MKEITKTSRLAGQLEKLFRMLNEDFFDGELDTPIITIQSTPRAYGHYSVSPIWTVKGEELRHEINIGAGTLDREIEFTVGTLLHEMCHFYNDTILNVQDCSRGGTYHNRQFKATAESVGLIVTKSEKYGWAHTAPADSLIEWILSNDVQEIQLNRNEGCGIRVTGGNSTANGGTGVPAVGISKPHNYRYECPCCHAVARSGRMINLICADCMELMIG